VKTIKVTFSDACTDVLVYLADLPAGQLRTRYGITEATTPADAEDAPATTANALQTLRDAGLVEARRVEDWVMWQATDAGREAVAQARAAAEVPS
jgi:DNA-binding PadR family transcriptional regulator